MRVFIGLPVTALMTPRPKIVFLNLDDPEEVNWRKIVTSGHSYFPVYQNSRDQIVGMDAGQVIARGTPAEVRRSPALIAAYLGVADDPAETSPASGSPA